MSDSPTAEDIETLLADFEQAPEDFTPEQLLVLSVIGSGEHPTVPDDDAELEECDEPVVTFSLLVSRAETYADEGVPVWTAIELALDDAIETLDAATDQDHTGPVGGLVS